MYDTTLFFRSGDERIWPQIVEIVLKLIHKYRKSLKQYMIE